MDAETITSLRFNALKFAMETKDRTTGSPEEILALAQMYFKFLSNTSLL